MKSISKFQHTQGILLLVAVTILWGTTFPLVKETIVSLSPGALIAIRCALAALGFAVHLRDLNKHSLRDGAILGLLLFGSLATQAIALETISANRAAFIASLNVILVTFLGQLLGQRVLVTTFLAAGLAVGGVGVMCWEDGVLSVGDLWMVGDVLCYTIYIMTLEVVTPRHPPLSLTAVQIWVVGVLATFWAAPELIGQLEAIATNYTNLIPILYLALVTAATTWLPAIAQKSVSAQETAIVYTFEPAFAAVFSFWLLGEKLGVRGWVGAGMVLAAMILSQIPMSNSPIKIVPLSQEQANAQEEVSESYQMLGLEPSVSLDLINSESYQMFDLEPSVLLDLK